MPHPFCFSCGYDLFGLEVPHTGPECGQIRDPAIDEPSVRRWFASGRNALTWLFRPSKIPAGIWYVLNDDASRRIARRREFRWLHLPAILTTVLVGVGCFVTIEYDVKHWYYEQSDPQRTPFRFSRDRETDRFYALNLPLRISWQDFLVPAWPSWVEVTERTPKRLALTVPDEFDSFFLLFGSITWFALLFGYLPIRPLIRRRASRVAFTNRKAELSNARLTAISLMAGPLGIATWLWVLFALVFGCGEAFFSNEDVSWAAAECLFFAASGAWVLASIVGFPVLICQDRATRFFHRRVAWCLALVTIALGGPVAAFYGTMKLLGW